MGTGYQPKPTANCSLSFFGSMGLCEATSDAEQTWVNNGFRNGFVVGSPWLGCSLRSGYIAVCPYDTQEQLRSARSSTSPSLVGCTTRVKTNPNPLMTHIDRVVVRLCAGCFSQEWHGRHGLRNGDRGLARHEYGHALGPSHNITNGSVMNSNGTGILPDAHDRDAMGTLYNGHNDG